MRVSNLYKAPKGSIKIDAEVENGIILNIEISGDFVMVPAEDVKLLENHLRGVVLDEKEINRAISDFYAIGVVTPTMTKEDFVKAIIGLKNHS